MIPNPEPIQKKQVDESLVGVAEAAAQVRRVTGEVHEEHPEQCDAAQDVQSADPLGGPHGGTRTAGRRERRRAHCR